MTDDQKAKLLQAIQQDLAALAAARIQYEARARVRPASANSKPIAQLIAELKASVPQSEAIRRSFTPENRQEEGGVAAGKLAATMERVGLILESFDAVAHGAEDGAAVSRAGRRTPSPADWAHRVADRARPTRRKAIGRRATGPGTSSALAPGRRRGRFRRWSCGAVLLSGPRW